MGTADDWRHLLLGFILCGMQKTNPLYSRTSNSSTFLFSSSFYY